MNWEFDKLLHKAILAALDAGKAINHIYQGEIIVNLKADNSPITKADRDAYDIIKQSLEDTQIPLLSEEGNIFDYAVRRNFEYFWLVDPLDGTKEFINRNGEFTVNIALMDHDKPIAGVVYAPVPDVLYFASEGRSAYKINSCLLNNKLSTLQDFINIGIKLPSIQNTGKFIVVSSRSHINPETTQYIEEITRKHEQVELISTGSSLKFCLIAEEKAQLYPRFGTTMEWDTAAGHVIVKLAGGKVIPAQNNEELHYNKPDLRNPFFIVYGNGISNDDVLKP